MPDPFAGHEPQRLADGDDAVLAVEQIVHRPASLWTSLWITLSGAQDAVQVAVCEHPGRVELVAYAEEVVEVRVDPPE